MHVAQDLIPSLRTTPQPVALAIGRVVRTIGLTEKLDACVKAAEVISRYVAVAGLASAAAERTSSHELPKVDGFDGNLSFGSFEKAARAAYGVPWDHPLRQSLKNCLVSSRKRVGIAGVRLEQFVKLRNELGHAITPADEPRARVLMERDDPVGALLELVDALDDILSLPLLVVLSQQHRRGRLMAHVAFFAGEGEPIPQELELANAIFDWEVPYLCTPGGLLRMSPGLTFAPKSTDGRLGLHLIDAVFDDGLRYKSVQDVGSVVTAEGLPELAEWVRLPFMPVGVPARSPAIEVVDCLDGRSLYDYLSGADMPRPSAEDDGNEDATPQPSSVREFERRLNALDLGSAFRDVLYVLLETGAVAEVKGAGIRVLAKGDPSRVIATMEVTPGHNLAVALFRSPGAGEESGAVVTLELQPGCAADDIVESIRGSIHPTEAPATRGL